jgi:hypothetical protein
MAINYIDKKGYPRYANSGKLVHISKAKKKLGSNIWKGRVVHHRDDNKHNYRRSNLQVMTRSGHSRLHAKKRNKRFKKKRWDDW